MNSVLKALRAYESVNSKLPCPADATKPMGDPNYGKAAFAISDCRGGSPAANYADTTNHIAIGMVPFKTLGLPKEYALDAYG
jgi:hypothetical protein